MARDRKTTAQYGYRRSPDQDLAAPAHHPVIVVGAGPVGMTLALDLAARGIAPVLLDDADRIGEGSRGICWSKRTLEIFDRLGVADRMLAKGVVWQKGRVFLADREVYEFDLLPGGGHKMPAFINLQQYYVEQELADAILEREAIDLRWRNRVAGIERHADGATISIETPDGPYRLGCDWLVCCDGARSPCRAMLGLAFEGEAFEDRFLIADVKMTAAFPTERWFWFDPPFHSGQSALLHKQPDDIWRIDLQLGPDADPEDERRPERVVPRIRRMLGHADFELEWVSVYRFQCRRLPRFVHGRVVFAGDAAHQVSPFGARGANSGIQDAENLAWKLAAVIAGHAPPSLVDSYDLERGQAADENIRHSTRSTDFIAPRTRTERLFRNAALELASHTSFAKRFVNSGRLSAPTVHDTPLSTPDTDAFAGEARLGAPVPDAPVLAADGRLGWLLEQLAANRCTALCWGVVPGLIDRFSTASADGAFAKQFLVVGRDLTDADGLLTSRLDATPGAVYLIRPDQHLFARTRHLEPGWLAAALDRVYARDRGNP
jgi:3-(3-hydroxy-phenyl)propionate hydroxylase